MKIPCKALVLVCLLVATGSVAQTVGTSSNAASSVDEKSPSTHPLAGTLFFGQSQRDQMDRARKRGDVSVGGVSDEPAASVLNGFVKRSDGVSAIWIDGQARFNVQGENVRRLQPGDVGGPADRVKVVSANASRTMPVSQAPQTKKIPLRKTLHKRSSNTR